MSKIRGKDTKPELFVKEALIRLKVRFTYQAHGLPGTPDFLIDKTALFVDGDFWHLRKLSTLRKVNWWWKRKLLLGKYNELKKRLKLKLMGYRVIKIWEKDLPKIDLKEFFTINGIL